MNLQPEVGLHPPCSQRFGHCETSAMALQFSRDNAHAAETFSREPQSTNTGHRAAVCGSVALKRSMSVLPAQDSATWSGYVDAVCRLARCQEPLGDTARQLGSRGGKKRCEAARLVYLVRVSQAAYRPPPLAGRGFGADPQPAQEETLTEGSRASSSELGPSKVVCLHSGRWGPGDGGGMCL